MTSTDVKELKRRRGIYKARLTGFSTYLSSLNLKELQSVNIMELQLRVTKLEELYGEEFDKVQLELELLEDNPAIEMSERIKIEAQYYSLIAQAKDIINNFSKPSHSLSSRRSSSHVPVKLPTIQLPKFSGLYDNWLEFRDTFTSLVHDNDDIDEINKFHYLRSSLEGSAAVMLQSYEFSAKNYSVAWNLLCERFDNKRLLIQNHVSAIFNMDQIVKESSVSLKRIIDQVNKNIRALSALDEPVSSWDTLLIYIVSRKLDTKTFREWEEHKSNIDKTQQISFSQFIQFIQNRADMLETLELSRHTSLHSQPQTRHLPKNNTQLKALVSVNNNNSSNITCPRCKADHKLSNCSQFLALNTKERLSSLHNYKVCYNCFRSGHYSNQCKKTGCKICNRKHHTLIHVADFKRNCTENVASPELVNANVKVASSSLTPSNDSPVALSATVAAHTSCLHTHSNCSGNVLLSTALIKLYDKDNYEFTARALLDSGSTSCLITERLFKKLNLPYIPVEKSIQGINNSLSYVGKMCRVHIKSLSEDYCTKLQCFVLPTITDNIPIQHIDIRNLNIPSNIKLCDPNFHKPAAIDLVIGADVFWRLLGSEKISLGDGNPMLYQTRLGWLVCGPINSGYAKIPSSPVQCNFTKLSSCNDIDSSHLNDKDDIQNLLTRFWQLEEVCFQSSAYSEEEKLCEEHFVKNTTRLSNGRFCVRIPIKAPLDTLGDSLQRAKRCFLSLERRNQSRPLFNNMYKDFMSEYISLNHMSECSIDEVSKSYFMPHHGVLREGNLTTKLRVVFNASAPTTSGVSFNHIQMVGPTVQDDLLSILLRFRMYKYILSADVEKMYRQISVHPSDRNFQKIIWRDDPISPLKAYQLNTVTYGTSSAPFLATRCLKQIGLECTDQRVAQVIIHDLYVDDLLTGENDFEQALALREKITDALSSACMPLRKWKSNEPALVPDKSLHSSLNLNIGETELNKTLGLHWQTYSDELRFSISIPQEIENTKRGMLAVIARIFDPLGLLSPCVIRMKHLMQRLWLEKLAWHEQLPGNIQKTWVNIISSLPALNDLRIPRHVVCNFYQTLELHIFCDASEQAYGACIYVRSVNEQGDVQVRLLAAKSRVAPLRPVSVPRLELCAALVGARLYEKVISSIRDPVSCVTFWTDSMVVLGWLRMLPIKLNTFVRNRVGEIHDVTSIATWRHVPTKENPADLISRGVDANIFQSLDIWWSGPSFLQRDKSSWPRTPETQCSLPEMKPDVSLHAAVASSASKQKCIVVFEHFSTLSRLQRTVAYIFRFIQGCKGHKATSKHLNTEELHNALNFIIIQTQRDSFPEYNLLLNNQKLPNKNYLLKLNPFLDDDKIMRVGGRLTNSNFSYNKKHPILLQSTHHFTKLLFRHEHIKLMHAGPQLLLATIRETYWPLGGRNLAKNSYHNCVRCRRMKGQTIVTQMGNLPSDRLSPEAFPFQNVGIDYAGPISSASRQGRGCRLVKVYIALFVCFTTKAVHLELVGDLTSQSYLNALRRFMSRRGKPLNIYSDNGTTFVGAFREISNFLKNNCSSIAENLANEGINFHFIPAYAPHFGGLWEAGVKSTKHHLVRVLGNCNLTYEELNTTLIQIEAILNSRPLTPLSSEPEDLTPLTPSHFIIGRPLTSLPVKDHRDYSAHCLTRYQRIEQLRQHFWTRWSKEYICELQQRTKWRACKDALKLNTLVLIKEDNLPPLKWKLGRVICLHPGTDGVSRVADIKTASGVVRRAFTKICPLLEGSG